MGRIVAPFGIKGWVKIQPYGDDPLDWAEMPQWWLAPSEDAPESACQMHALRDCRAHGNQLIASFEGITDRNAAETLKGLFVAAPREAMPDTDEDEYYWADLIGLAVVNQQGVELGVVDNLLSTGAHDVLRIKDGDTERLIPFVQAYVLEVDTAARRVLVDWQSDW
jgi:16S rRNA processing protein RimM